MSAGMTRVLFYGMATFTGNVSPTVANVVLKSRLEASRQIYRLQLKSCHMCAVDQLYCAVRLLLPCVKTRGSFQGFISMQGCIVDPE